MKRAIFILVLINFLFSEDFISEFEYGQMLFNNPRGVSCAKCHGNLGKGEYIASFKDSKGKVHKFFGPDITNISKERFKKALDKGGLLMPRYYLTQTEIDAIYKYLKVVNSHKNKSNTILTKIDNEVDTNSSNLLNINNEDEIKEFNNSAPDFEEFEKIKENSKETKENNEENSIIFDIFNNISEGNE